MQEKDLRTQQEAILKKIINDSITKISYHHPEKQLGKLGKDHDKAREILWTIERDSRAIYLDPKLKFPRRFWFAATTGYRVDLEKVKQLLDSLQSKN